MKTPKEKVRRYLKSLNLSTLDIIIILKELYYEIGLNVDIEEGEIKNKN